ncbi:HDOD domain-containing protein [Herbaspirillum sp. AP02]|uniref:HDOD domain-containing protein n=1 Tax=unclassified Herbaspirillum TaxID=2624150 RepID=UPI0015DA5776|nr:MULTISPECIES: HDOD domain-containing protein [unclassified Herbaspirillum]MBG7619869.1 HDOD domain-containing protein [Herbaspirillum sp. AP02]NZD69067.1 HDOD domain-containing protein [Herbaspirillum sp. AP21]
MELKSLVDQPGKLPTIPKVVQQLMASFNAEDVSAQDIAQQIAADPALTAKVLRLANSAFFHASRTIGTVDDALRMLGFIMVRNLVLGNGMVAAFKNTRGMDLHQFWLHTLYTAVASRWLAMHAGHAGEDNGDAVFTVAMMHGIGQLQLHAVAAAAVAPLDKQCNVLDDDRAEREKAAWGFHYADVSAELATLWHFPDAMTNALRSTPDPLAAGRLERAAAWVHLGAWAARVEVLALEDAAALASYPAALAKKLGVDAAWRPVLVKHAPDQAERAMPSFSELSAGLDAMLE